VKSTGHIQRVYYVILAFFWFSTALPLALLVLIHQTRGLDLFNVGILMGTYSLTIVFLEVPTGGLADAVGRKKVTQIAYAISFISSLVFLFAFSFPAFLLAWILSGVSRALGSGAIDAWFIDALQGIDPEIEIQPLLAKAGTVTLLALAAGTLVGGALPRLFSHLPAEGTAVVTPMVTTIILASVLKLLLLGVVTAFVHENRLLSRNADWKAGFLQVPEIVRDALKLSRSNRTIVALLLAALVGGLGLASIETFWQPHFGELLGGSQGRSLFFGAVMAVSFIVGATGNIASIPLGRLLNRRYGLLTALIQGVQGLAFVLLALQEDILSAVVFFWFIYWAIGSSNSPYTTLLNQEIPAERRSSMLSIQSLASYVGGIAGSVVLGYLANNFSISIAWIVAGVLLLVSLPLYVGIDSRRARQAKGYDPETAVL
jgi:MFS family permease